MSVLSGTTKRRTACLGTFSTGNAARKICLPRISLSVSWSSESSTVSSRVNVLVAIDQHGDQVLARTEPAPAGRRIAA